MHFSLILRCRSGVRELLDSYDTFFPHFPSNPTKNVPPKHADHSDNDQVYEALFSTMTGTRCYRRGHSCWKISPQITVVQRNTWLPTAIRGGTTKLLISPNKTTDSWKNNFLSYEGLRNLERIKFLLTDSWHFQMPHFTSASERECFKNQCKPGRKTADFP